MAESSGIITKLLSDTDQESQQKKKFERGLLLRTAQDDKADPQERGMAMERLFKEAKLGPKESQNLLHMVQMVTGGGGTEMADKDTGQQQQPPSQPQPTPSTGATSSQPQSNHPRLSALGHGAATIGLSALEGALTQGRSAEYDIQQMSAQREQQRTLEREKQQSQLKTQEEIAKEQRARSPEAVEDFVNRNVQLMRAEGQIKSDQDEMDFRRKLVRAHNLIQGGMGEEQAYTAAGLPYRQPPTVKGQIKVAPDDPICLLFHGCQALEALLVHRSSLQQPVSLGLKPQAAR